MKSNDRFRMSIRDRDQLLANLGQHDTAAMFKHIDELEFELDCARTILRNMAKENEGIGSWFLYNRWQISHEPLRADAKARLPYVENVLMSFDSLKYGEKTAGFTITTPGNLNVKKAT